MANKNTSSKDDIIISYKGKLNEELCKLLPKKFKLSKDWKIERTTRKINWIQLGRII